ncbi:MAG: hypothetical protein ACK4QW_09965 [Alphaproteobacteria bacterium]
MTKKQPPDWLSIERDFTSGTLSAREIARNHGVSHSTVNRRARHDGWSRRPPASQPPPPESFDAAALLREIAADRAVPATARVQALRALLAAGGDMPADDPDNIRTIAVRLLRTKK